MVQKKAWYYSKERFQVPLGRGKDKSCSFTVFGALGECITTNCFYHEIHKSTNAIAFSQFILNLAENIEPSPDSQLPLLILDNHNAGRGERKELMDKYFQVMYLPIYSSELSSVETAWALLKAKVRPEFTKLLIRKKCTKQKFI